MAVAGLLKPDSCRIDIDGTVLADTKANVWCSPESRRIGLVFQDARLFPHMSVLRNLNFGARRARSGPIRFDDVVNLLGIEHLLNQRPYSLSGGERQRVAIGRVLLAQPTLLAMDEPLASLDAPRKAEILPFLARLKTVLKLPILYVTHSTEELASLADTLVLLKTCSVVAAGPLEQIITRSDLPLAVRDDSGAVLTASVIEHDKKRQSTTLRVGPVTFYVSLFDREPGTAGHHLEQFAVKVRCASRAARRHVDLARIGPTGSWCPKKRTLAILAAPTACGGGGRAGKRTLAAPKAPPGATLGVSPGISARLQSHKQGGEFDPIISGGATVQISPWRCGQAHFRVPA
jgi:molybdenum ABC transporter ATP-binding protein